jgi:hypothetical protein
MRRIFKRFSFCNRLPLAISIDARNPAQPSFAPAIDFTAIAGFFVHLLRWGRLLMVVLPLTNEQHAARASLSRAKVLPVIDPWDNRTYFLVPADAYARLRAEADRDAGGAESLYPLLDELARREGWDDPATDAYDLLDPRKAT